MSKKTQQEVHDALLQVGIYSFAMDVDLRIRGDEYVLVCYTEHDVEVPVSVLTALEIMLDCTINVSGASCSGEGVLTIRLMWSNS